MRSIEEIGETGSAWITEFELTLLCAFAKRAETSEARVRELEAALRDMTFDQWGAPTCWPNQERVMEILRDTAPREGEE